MIVAQLDQIEGVAREWRVSRRSREVRDDSKQDRGGGYMSL